MTDYVKITKSTILLQNYGKMLSHKRAKLIKANSFFITDKINQGDIVVKTSPCWASVDLGQYYAKYISKEETTGGYSE